MNDSSEKIERFPRELTKVEKDLLFTILPETKPGYKNYRRKINELFVIGTGRFGDNNLILGEKSLIPDTDSPSTPVFASGTISTTEDEIDVLIHEETEDQIEIDISPKNHNKIPPEINIINSWNYSEWMPGNRAPKDNSDVREIKIDEKYILAIAQLHKKIWLYEYDSGINYLIPVTNFYNYLMIVKKIRDEKIVLNYSLLFKNPETNSDEEIISAFILYNKYFRRIKNDFSLIKEISRKEKEKTINKILKFLKKDK